MEKGQLIFISGGARSGKSTFAERYACSNKSITNLIYIATSYGNDKEMEQRIANHQKQRMKSGYHWQTIECPVKLASAVDTIGENDVVLIDCLTVLLTNELVLYGENEWQHLEYQQKISERILSGIERIREQAQQTIVVSNEVLNEPISDYALVQTYCKLIGDVHQTVIQQADEAYLVEAGVPIEMKGDVSL